jgi:hypothetical protein
MRIPRSRVARTRPARHDVVRAVDRRRLRVEQRVPGPARAVEIKGRLDSRTVGGSIPACDSTASARRSRSTNVSVA